MADKKISELNALTVAANDDVLPIVDTSETETKKISFTNLTKDISHTNISDIGTNTHAQIDTHIASGAIHFAEDSISHTNISDIGTNTHAQIDTHIASGAIHFADAAADSKTYGRKNNAWEEVTSGGGGSHLFCSSISANYSAVVRYHFPTGNNTVGNSLEAACGNIIVKAGTLKNFYVKFGYNAVSSNITFTVRKNGADTDITLTVTSNSTATFSDTTNTASVAVGDVITIEVDCGGTGSVRGAMSLELEYS